MLPYLIALGAFCIAIGYQDATSRRISNKVIIALFITQAIFIDVYPPQVYSAIIVLVAGGLLYQLKIFGAGDIKFATVLALALPIQWLPQALWWTLIFGGALSMFYLIKYRLVSSNQQALHSLGLPYGIAIGSGFYVVIASYYIQGG